MTPINVSFLRTYEDLCVPIPGPDGPGYCLSSLRDYLFLAAHNFRVIALPGHVFPRLGNREFLRGTDLRKTTTQFLAT
jgi:hypothetical protein